MDGESSQENSEITSPTLSSEITSPDVNIEITRTEVTAEVTSPDVTAEVMSPDVDTEITSPVVNSEVTDVNISYHAEESPMLSDASSTKTSPENTSTVVKKKKETMSGGSRRSSGRVKAKPAYFDASPIAAAVKSTQSPKVASPALSELSAPKLTSPTLQQSNSDDDTLVEEEDSEDEVEEEPIVFKKPLPIPKRKDKVPLNISVKKGKTPNSSLKSKSRSSEMALFEIVKDGKSAVVSVINDWIEAYNNDKILAMVTLIEFFVQSSGCHANVTQAMINEEDTVRAIRHLTENFAEEAEEYPLVITRPEYKKFKTNFSTFIFQLINNCQHSIIYDGDMMDILISWIIGLSDSQVRAFRHTSTLAGMKIVSSLIDVALKVNSELDKIQKQLDGENQKSASKKSREKLEKLQKRREEINQRISELEDMMNRIFIGIFMHRYRDVRPEIRSICIAEMCAWMNNYSSYFLDQNYLKYLGWTLYDKVREVRLEVLKGLEELYRNENFIENLELFTGRFKERIIFMTLDVETDVAVQAIKIATLLYKYEALEEDDCSQVEQLVFCDQRRMAHAAGEFLALRVVNLSKEASPKKLRKGHKEEYLKQLNIKAILDFFIKTEIHEHCAYIVDSLREHTDLLKDWKMLTNLLMDTNTLIDLEDEEESALIDLLCCAVKQATTGLAPPGRHVNRKQSQKDKKIHMEDRHNISSHFMEHLPALIEKYKADVPKVSELLVIPQYFDLEVYAEKRLTKHLELLLKHMQDIVEMHADAQLLETCSDTYHYLINNELVIQQTAEVSRNQVVDKFVDRFHGSIANGIPHDNEQTDTYFNIIYSMKRIYAFSINHDISGWDLYGDVHSIIEQGVKDSVDEEVLTIAIRIMSRIFIMDLNNLDEEKPSKFELKAFRKRQRIYVKHLHELLQYNIYGVKIEAFKLLCDFFVIFSKQLLLKVPTFAQIVCDAEETLQLAMRDFVVENVFNNTSLEDDLEDDEEDDGKAKELYDKRLLLAGLCKLFGFQVFDIKLAGSICLQFLRSYENYADIIRQLMQLARVTDLIRYAKMLLISLQQAFETLRDDSDGVIDTKSKEFSDIKDLAHRFALMLGVNINADSTRKTTITIHREGITYAFTKPDNLVQSSQDHAFEAPPPNLLFLEVLHEFVNRIVKVDKKVIHRHLVMSAGDLLSQNGDDWMPLQTYKKALESGANETRQYEEAEQELQNEMVLEKKKKKQPVTFIANTTRRISAVDKGKAKKKLSMSKVGGTGKWLSKTTIADEKNTTSPPKVAKGIPKARASAEKKRKRPSSLDEPDFKVVESKTVSPKKSPRKTATTKKAVATSPRKTPKKMAASPRSKSPKVTPKKVASQTTPNKKKTSAKKGAVVASPVLLNSSIDSSGGRRNQRRKNESPEETLQENSDMNSSISDGKSVNTQHSWLLSNSPRASAKRQRKSYGKAGRDTLDTVLVGDSSRSLARSVLKTRNSQDSDASSTSSPREARASKRQKRDTSSVLNDSQDSQQSLSSVEAS